MNLSYPFRLYPWKTSTNLFPNYINKDLYLSEVNNLYNYLKDNKNIIYQKKTLIIFIIGSLIDDTEELSKEWRQHMPKYIHNYLDNNVNSHIELILISPSEIDGYPRFIKESNNFYNWEKQSDRYSIHNYQSEKYNKLSYRVFNCPVPEYIENDFESKDNKIFYYCQNSITHHKIPKYFTRNKGLGKRFSKVDFASKNRYYLKYKNNIDEFDIPLKKLMDISTTDNDHVFVIDFYLIFKQFIKNIKRQRGHIHTLNYSVFNRGWGTSDCEFFIKTFSKNLIDYGQILHYNWSGSPIENKLYDLSNNHIYDYNENLILSIDSYNKIEIKKYSNFKKLIIIKTDDNRKNLFEIIKNKENDFYTSILEQNSYDIDIKSIRQKVLKEMIYQYDNNEIFRNKVIFFLTSETSPYINLYKIGMRHEEVFDIFLNFIKNEKICKVSEQNRIKFNLEKEIYNITELEIEILSYILEVKIGIIDGKNIKYVGDYDDKVFVRKFNNDFYIAKNSKYYI